MAPKDDRTPPATPPAAAPRPDRPVPACPPSATPRAPARKVVVSGRLLDNLRRTFTECGELHLLVSEVLATIDDQRPVRGAGATDCAESRAGKKRDRRPRLPPVWIRSLWMARNADGSLDAVIDDVPLVLKPHLGALFIALAEDAGVSDDEGVGFKTLDELAAHMAKLTGGRVLPGTTINKYIHKLREKLLALVGLPSDVIQSRHGFGRRLAIKRATLGRGRHARPQATWPSSQASAESAER